MSGIGHFTFFVLPTGQLPIDGILNDKAWLDQTIEYSFPTSSAEYGNYAGGEDEYMFSVSPLVQDMVHFALSDSEGPSIQDGFSVEGLTELDFDFVTTPGAHIRVVQTTDDPYGYGTAWAYSPTSGKAGGDVWLSDVRHDYSSPEAGNYAAFTIMHELGHALGLEHAHEATSFGAVPVQYDAMEYTIMTYRSFQTSQTDDYSNETWGFAQTYMMLDIAALQYLYGADYSTNSGNTVYSWTPDTGETFIDGTSAITPGDNRIFATLWDGGGKDTYDLSAYTDGVYVDLNPGGYSLFSDTQQVDLGAGNLASGNIYNALLYEDSYKSMIENAIGGSGRDYLTGNAVANNLQGRLGNDIMVGGEGNDHLLGASGADMLFGEADNDTLDGGNNDDGLFGGNGRDTLHGGAGNDTMFGGNGDDILNGGADNDRMSGCDGVDILSGDTGDDWLNGGREGDTLKGGAGNDILFAGTGDDFVFGGFGADILDGAAGNDVLNGDDGNDLLIAGFGDDVLDGGSGEDILIGGLGHDNMTGGAGADVFRFERANDSPSNGDVDVILDFETGLDLIDLADLSEGPISMDIGGEFTGDGSSAYTQLIGRNTFVFVDTDGDAKADFELKLAYSYGLSVDDFVL